ncbi:MAG: type II secretion system protein [Marinagarivorans sp.]|nr:type II secretion system protein [Marinagarivorans sp.]
MYPKPLGFTLVELVAVILILGVLTVTVIARVMPSRIHQLQGARDIVVASLFNAQQKALAQNHAVQVITTATSVDIRVDNNDDGSFSVGESITYAGTRYPLTLPSGVSLNANTLTFDRLGRTPANSLTLSKSGGSVNLTITGMGYAY